MRITSGGADSARVRIVLEQDLAVLHDEQGHPAALPRVGGSLRKVGLHRPALRAGQTAQRRGGCRAEESTSGPVSHRISLERLAGDYGVPTHGSAGRLREDNGNCPMKKSPLLVAMFRSTP